MARNGRKFKRRKPSNAGPKVVLALLVVASVVATLLVYEHFGPKPLPVKKVEVSQAPTTHLPIPLRPQAQANLSSAAAPSGKAPAAVAPLVKGPGRLAIIIDDMGSSMQEVRALMSIKLPLTFSVIPGLAHASGVAEAAHGAGYQVMLHMPMEPEGYPKKPMEKSGLLLAMDDGEIERRVSGYFDTVPYAAGANNHMGSRFTQDGEKMAVVLKVLKGKGLFFVDSRTSPASVGYETAKELGLKCATRQVFLDNVQDESAIGRQLSQAAALAAKRGGAIAICHPHPATIRALKALMPEMSRRGITFVAASTLTS